MSTSCAHMTVLRIEELKQVEAHIDSVTAEIVAQQQKILAEQAQLNELIRFSRADQQTRFNEVDKTLDALKKASDESQTQLSQIVEKTFDIKRKWEEQAKLDSARTVRTDAEKIADFETAQTEYKSGKYESALQNFDAFLKRYPSAPEAEEALLFSAECLVMTSNPEAGEQKYKSYIKNYPQGKRICEALYKLGQLYEKAKKIKAKEMVWAKLVSQCPDSEFAKNIKSKK